MIGALIKRRNLVTETQDQGECYVKIEVMLTQTKELPEAGRGAWTRSSPRAFREARLSDALVLHF